MTKFDLQALATQLNMLAEVYEKKPVSPKALEVWFDTLKDFPAERVLSFLISWHKTHPKFPVPSDVWKVCNESSIVQREEQAERERAMNVAEPCGDGAKWLAKIRATFGGEKRAPMDHWRHVLNTAPRGSIGHEYASEILNARTPEREPGQDDEERAAA